ncbi:MAG: hemerythrin domain-containing protein [Armatimonadetes bacterium]|nr:hemerythrin domain-containing protein [Armatimonadota bacterium]
MTTQTHPAAARLRAEHDELMQAQAELGRARRAFLDAPSGETREQFSNTLTEFAEHLQEHFEEEEDGGILQATSEHSQRVSAEVDRLRAEHEAMRGEMRVLSSDLRSRLEDPAQVAVVGHALDELLHHLGDHERAENRLVLDAYWDDSGSGD